MQEENDPQRAAEVSAVRVQKGGYPGETEMVRQFAGAEFVESCYANDTQMEMHTHSRPFLHLVLAGSVANRSERAVTTIEVAQAEFFPAFTPHETRWRGGGKGFAVQFGSQKAAEWLEWGILPQHPLTLPPGLVSALLLAAHRECFANDAAGGIGAESYLVEALAEVLRLPRRENQEHRSRRLWEAREILLDTYETPPTLTEVARQIEVHPVYLARSFRCAFGETVGDCIRRRRVEAACRLIARSERPLSEIAFDVGFADQSHFTRTFKQCLGIPPSEYARLMRPAKKSSA